jgi:hypothetical protein
MTTIFTFEDDYAVIADTKEEAIERRLESWSEEEDTSPEEFEELTNQWRQGTISKSEMKDFHDLDTEFTVVKQPESLTESRHPFLLETFGKDLDKALATAPHHIWTILTGDDNLDYIVAGIHMVNRMSYLQTIKPWRTGDETYLF